MTGSKISSALLFSLCLFNPPIPGGIQCVFSSENFSLTFPFFSFGIYLYEWSMLALLR